MVEPSFWHWLILGLALMILEILTPSSFFLWLGAAAMIVGGLLWLMPGMGLGIQLILFSALSILTIALGRRYLRRHPIPSDHPTLNRRGIQSKGRILTLDTPIVNGVGRARMDDTLWRVIGPDLPAGSRVKVIGVEGNALRVRPLLQDEEAGEGEEGRDTAPDGGDGGD